jgi:hypothetical protein
MPTLLTWHAPGLAWLRVLGLGGLREARDPPCEGEDLVGGGQGGVRSVQLAVEHGGLALLDNRDRGRRFKPPPKHIFFFFDF